MMIRCTLCGAADSPVNGPQAAGWTQVQIHAPRGNRYIVACPTHPPADVASWVKSALTGKGK